MTLLWRSPDAKPRSSAPGPKRRLDTDDIVAAAIAVADANGSAGVSMRAVAERLGVTPMALYGYVPSKEALVGLMYDAVHSEMPDPSRLAGGWRPQVLVWAEDLVDLYVAHPWALRVAYARPVLGPNEQEALELLVRVLRGTALEPGKLRRVIGMLFHAVRGTALTITEAQEAANASGTTEDEWWQRSSRALARVVPDFADRFPETMWLFSQPDEVTTTEAGDYVDRQARANLRVGLGVLLDGVEAAITGQAGVSPGGLTRR